MTNPIHALLIMRLLFVILVLTLVACANGAVDQQSQTLTKAVDVLSLSPEQAAQGLPVLVRGVVTVEEPSWAGRFFIQDETGGVFVENLDSAPVAGDLVEVSGISHPGAFAPMITKPHWQKIGTAQLPEAKWVPIDQLMAGIEDGQRVEVSGIVRSVQTEKGISSAELVSGGYRFRVWGIPPTVDPEMLMGAEVRIRGTAAARFNAQLRHLITVAIFIPSATDFIIEKAESINPFREPVVSLKSIAQYRRGDVLGKRIHVKGTVICQQPGEGVFLQDATGGLRVKTSQPGVFAVGDVIEAIGFPGFEHFLPVLQDAVLKKTQEPRSNIAPNVVPIQEIQDGMHHADLITLKGKLIDRTIVGPRQQNAERTLLTLQSTNLLFTVIGTGAEQAASLALIPIGSTLEVSGVSLAEINEEGKLRSLQLLLPNLTSARVLEKPSWLTSKRLLASLAVISVVLLVAVSWTVMVSKRNAALKASIHEKEKAQRELQCAHDLLEERVKERTAQLKFEMTARKESELEFKAVIGERTRLAQELHDSLEQTLTGIGLQLDTAGKLLPKDQQGASHHLELGCNLIRQSQVELRQSIWDLRSRELEEFELSSALRRCGEQVTAGTGVHVEVETEGDIRAMSEIVEENLLRIGQEALTNVVKHAGASQVKIQLEYGSEGVVLQLQDNGRGFSPESCPGFDQGHFGLLGMSERAKRLNGRLSVTSALGKGTMVRVEIPLGMPQQIKKTHLANANRRTHDEDTNS